MLGLFIFSCDQDSIDGEGSFNPSSEANLLANDSSFFGPNGSGTGTGTDGEGYNEVIENPWVDVADESTSTFSIDADGGSYANVRRFLEQGQEPIIDAIRTEELINFFKYDYPEPESNAPIALDGEISTCPWNSRHKLLRVGLKGKHIDRNGLASANFVFLIDVSGSMAHQNKLPLLKEAFTMFADHMRPDDRVAIVTYSGRVSVCLLYTSPSPRDRTRSRMPSSA